MFLPPAQQQEQQQQQQQRKRGCHDDSETESETLALQPSDRDVLLGRGAACWNHAGNRGFRAMVGGHLEAYAGAKLRVERSAIVCDILDAVQQQGGRFLKRRTETGGGENFKEGWHVVTKRQAIEKIGHAIRDKIALQVNKNHACSNGASYESSRDGGVTLSSSSGLSFRPIPLRRHAPFALPHNEANIPPLISSPSTHRQGSSISDLQEAISRRVSEISPMSSSISKSQSCSPRHHTDFSFSGFNLHERRGAAARPSRSVQQQQHSSSRPSFFRAAVLPSNQHRGGGGGENDEIDRMKRLLSSRCQLLQQEAGEHLRAASSALAHLEKARRAVDCLTAASLGKGKAHDQNSLMTLASLSTAVEQTSKKGETANANGVKKCVAARKRKSTMQSLVK